MTKTARQSRSRDGNGPLMGSALTDAVSAELVAAGCHGRALGDVEADGAERVLSLSRSSLLLPSFSSALGNISSLPFFRSGFFTLFLLPFSGCRPLPLLRLLVLLVELR